MWRFFNLTVRLTERRSLAASLNQREVHEKTLLLKFSALVEFFDDSLQALANLSVQSCEIEKVSPDDARVKRKKCTND